MSIITSCKRLKSLDKHNLHDYKIVENHKNIILVHTKRYIKKIYSAGKLNADANIKFMFQLSSDECGSRSSGPSKRGGLIECGRV